MDDIGLETTDFPQGFRELSQGRSKRRSTNEQRLVELREQAGEQIDELHLRTFRLMTPIQQTELLEKLQLRL